MMISSELFMKLNVSGELVSTGAQAATGLWVEFRFGSLEMTTQKTTLKTTQKTAMRILAVL